MLPRGAIGTRIADLPAISLAIVRGYEKILRCEGYVVSIVTDRLRNAGRGEPRAFYYRSGVSEIARLADRNSRERFTPKQEA